MRATVRNAMIRLMLLAGSLLAPLSVAAADAHPVPVKAIADLESMLGAPLAEASPARRRLATKRVIRQAEELITSHPDAANRFEVLSLLFRARQTLLALDDSPENRSAILETCRSLAVAPDEYAELRLDADLLLSQAEAARQGGDGKARMQALKPLVARYRDTPAEARILRIATVLALELGEQRLIDEFRQVMEVRFAGDPEMIEFMREKLGGQVFGAPFCGVFETSSGKRLAFPMNCLGRTTLLYFWSQEAGGGENLARLAAAWREVRPNAEGRLQMLSLNLDDLPDAGESLLRAAGADWPALRLPGGTDHSAYRAFSRSGSSIVTVSPTGYGAIIMAGATRKSPQAEGLPDYGRMLGSSLAREWTEPEYLAQLVSLLAGEFLIVPAGEPFDASRPPELAASTSGGSLPRPTACVPESTLLEIQACFTPPPSRYRKPIAETRAAYQRAADLCRTAIAAHPAAPDLWIVRNRLIVSLLGLWKVDAEERYFDEAVTESRAAIAGDAPHETDLVPQFCLAQNALRDSDCNPREAVTKFLASRGGDQASGPALAAAVMLALNSGDRGSYEACRRTILEKHTEEPMMWTLVAFLLDRYHQYQLFQAPFTAGWTPGRRAGYFMAAGKAEEANRTLRAELRPLDGGSFQIPEDLRGKWAVIIFAAPWSKEGAPSPEGPAKRLAAFAGGRPAGDVAVVLAVLDDDADKVKSLCDERPFPCPVMLVPGGMENPLVQRLGVQAENERLNAVLLRPDGRIAVFLSGLAMNRKGAEEAIPNVIENDDEQTVVAALDRGDIEEAKQLAFGLAPPSDSETADPRSRQPKRPPVSLAHLRARALVYLALEDWERALADAEALVDAETAISGGLSMRTQALDEAESLRARILRKGRDPR